MVKSESGQDRVPQVYFKANDSIQDEVASDSVGEDIIAEDMEQGTDEHMVDGKLVRTGKKSTEQLQISMLGTNYEVVRVKEA